LWVFPLRNLFTILKGERLPQQGGNADILQKLFDYLIGCHLNHGIDFCVALLAYYLFFPLKWDNFWTPVTVLAYNLCVMMVFCGGWHMVTYGIFRKQIWAQKYNQADQYETNVHLKREMLCTTLGYLQSATFMIVMMYLWSHGKVPYYQNFWDYPLYSLGFLALTTYWREFHFYWCHRAMHPWRRELPIIGDPGRFLYNNFHKLHHKSYNPGPWSGLSMHPVEHFLYYSVTLLPLLFPLNPLHFLYCKFHADIAPIGGHDGFGLPGGGADFHYLHHANPECNYGVPLVDFDRLFGTWMEYEDWKKKTGGAVSDPHLPQANSNSNKPTKKKMK